MSRGPYTVQALVYKGGAEYAPACDAVMAHDRPAMLRAARAAYGATGVIPDVHDAGGRYALHNDEVALWGIE